MKSGLQVAIAPLVLLLLALAPVAAQASRTVTFARSHNTSYHDRTPHVHDGTPKDHHHQKK